MALRNGNSRQNIFFFQKRSSAARTRLAKVLFLIKDAQWRGKQDEPVVVALSGRVKGWTTGHICLVVCDFLGPRREG